VSEIEISEAAKQAARELVLPKYFLPDERERLEWLINDVARHFDCFAIAATAAVEARVADAVKARDAQLIEALDGMRCVAVGHCSYEAAVAFRDAIAFIKAGEPTT